MVYNLLSTNYLHQLIFDIFILAIVYMVFNLPCTMPLLFSHSNRVISAVLCAS